MSNVNSVYVVQHLHEHDDGREDVKFIGVYESRASAKAAVARLSCQPGFCDWPEIVDSNHADTTSGFYIQEYEIGKDHWPEGYITVLDDD